MSEEAVTDVIDGEEKWDGKLSYSSFSQYMACNRKYYLRKVIKLAPDLDADADTLAFRFGKAFHKLLEDCKHDLSVITKETVINVCVLFQLPPEEHGPHLFALLRHYKKVQAKNGLVPTHFEVEISTPGFKGYVDVVLKDQDGPGWWIGDMKTASAYSQLLNSKLHTDWQLNLYVAHLQDIAEVTGHKIEDFRGCRYLLNVKSKMKRKDSDTFKSYAERLESAVMSYDIPVLKEEMQPESILSQFLMAKKEIDTLHKMKPTLAAKHAVPNFTCCTSYYKSCEYWSACHGKTFTELKERKVIVSAG